MVCVVQWFLSVTVQNIIHFVAHTKNCVYTWTNLTNMPKRTTKENKLTTVAIQLKQWEIFRVHDNHFNSPLCGKLAYGG